MKNGIERGELSTDDAAADSTESARFRWLHSVYGGQLFVLDKIVRSISILL